MGIEALALFLDWLFELFPLRKIYAETLAFNYDRFSSGEGTYFHIEGRLRDHEVHFGQLVDTYVIAFERSHWSINGQRLAQRLRASGLRAAESTEKVSVIDVAWNRAGNPVDL